MAFHKNSNRRRFGIYNDDIPKKRIAKQLNKDDKYLELLLKMKRALWMNSQKQLPPRP